jgi:hypothetical protein
VKCSPRPPAGFSMASVRILCAASITPAIWDMAMSDVSSLVLTECDVLFFVVSDFVFIISPCEGALPRL